MRDVNSAQCNMFCVDKSVITSNVQAMSRIYQNYYH